MKVLFVSSGRHGGKPNPIVQAQGDSLIALGVDLSFFSVNKGGIVGHLKEIFRLRKITSETSFDIIHAHYGVSALVALFSKRKSKLLVSFMGDDLVGTNRNDGSVTSLSRLFVSINKFLARRIYDHSIVKSEEMNLVLNSNRSTLIPNGVNLDVFKPMDRNEAVNKIKWNKEHHLILFVSDPSRAEKNYELAKNAVEALKNSNIQLMCIHSKDQSTLVDYYNAADALLLTSFHEGSPNVIKEAMACNCPIVSTPVGDVKELTANVDGCFIADFKVETVKDQILKAIEFRKVNNFTKGKEKIMQLKLDSVSVARSISDLYTKMLSK